MAGELKAPETGADAERHAAEIAMHSAIAPRYRIRYGSDFALLFHRHWNRALLDLLPAAAGGPVLDAGCGTGILLPDLTERFSEVYGIDLSPDMLAAARLGSPHLQQLKVGVLEALEFPDRFFGVVVCRGSLHHAADRPKAFAEIHRVLRPGGFWLLSEPSDDFFAVRWARALLYRLSSHFDARDRPFRARELPAVFGEHGFELLALRRFGYAAYLLAGFTDVFPLLRWLPGRRRLTLGLIRFDSWLARFPLLSSAGFHLMALGQKRGQVI